MYVTNPFSVSNKNTRRIIKSPFSIASSAILKKKKKNPIFPFKDDETKLPIPAREPSVSGIKVRNHPLWKFKSKYVMPH